MDNPVCVSIVPQFELLRNVADSFERVVLYGARRCVYQSSRDIPMNFRLPGFNDLSCSRWIVAKIIVRICNTCK